jgi:hypothetical protein
LERFGFGFVKVGCLDYFGPLNMAGFIRPKQSVNRLFKRGAIMPTPETFLPCRSDTHNIGDTRAIRLLALSEVGLRERSESEAQPLASDERSRPFGTGHRNIEARFGFAISWERSQRSS